MKKIWQKNKTQNIHEIIEKYTVGNDNILDIELLEYDIKATLAHGKMLYKIWILDSKELKHLELWLAELLKKLESWEFTIDISQEDGHTAIESFLTENYWEIWKKIHTGRSRNDQILVTMRLYTLDMISKIESKIDILIGNLEKKKQEIGDTNMPWYTHTQKAMPSKVWWWLWMYSDSLNDTKILLDSAKEINNQNPLWSAAGYWAVWLWLDRDFTTNLLWFEKVQENPLYCWYSRWKFEYITLQTLSHIMIDLWKMANELVYFSSSEFNFFTLPDSFKTGSSIMPQKKNWDIMELVRWNTNLFLWYEFQIREIYKMLFTWYNRDFQLTKEPYLKWIKLVQDTLDVMILVIQNVWVNEDILNKSMTPELYATEEAYKLVKNWMNFRDAYKKVGKEYVS